MTPRIEIIGDATLYLGEAADVLPTLQAHDALVVARGLPSDENKA